MPVSNGMWYHVRMTAYVYRISIDIPAGQFQKARTKVLPMISKQRLGCVLRQLEEEAKFAVDDPNPHAAPPKTWVVERALVGDWEQVDQIGLEA